MATARRAANKKVFSLFLIKPSHYDDDGYVIQWLRTSIPSNTLACLYGITQACIESKVLGDKVDIAVTALDETNTRIKTDKIIRTIKAGAAGGLVALVGVQTNQFPRAVDIARPLRAAGIPVCIGGFHASGCLAMLPKVPAEIEEAWELGISIFAGEAEGRFGALLQDAHCGQLKKLYNFMTDLPDLGGAEIPFLPAEKIMRNLSARTSFDSGRGCPFQCSFCTIINVQGRKSRYRSAADIEQILRANFAQGIRRFFITDDNFARNRNWEAIFDVVIKLREDEGMNFKLIIQVDTLCHRIPNFVAKAGRAGVNRVFIGLENINPDNLLAAKKRQNRITEYRTMLQAWKNIGAMTYCGYIIGFPNDTRESVLRDIDIIKRELPVDLLEFFCLTPLPGSEDHKVLDAKGVAMDRDMNNYDTEHVTTAHPRMSEAEWFQTYQDAWHAYYSLDHVETLLRRAAACGIKVRRMERLALWFYAAQTIERVHPLQAGAFRLKYRRDRRPGMPQESPLVFYPRYFWETASKALRLGRLVWQFRRLRKMVESDPRRRHYQDLALTPVDESELDELALFSQTDSAKMAVEKRRKHDALRLTRVAAE